MKILEMLGITGGTSPEQGRYHSPTETKIPRQPGALKKLVDRKPSELPNRTGGVLRAVNFANRRDRVSRGRFGTFPLSASEARYPQKVGRGRGK